MGLETASTIYGLNEANPPGDDDRPEGDNHLRLIKGAIKGTFKKGTLASRPAAGTEGVWYLSTDTRELYYDDGTSWVRISGLGRGRVVSADETLLAVDRGATIFVDTSSGNVVLTLPAEADAEVGWYVNILKTVEVNDAILNDDASTELTRLYHLEEEVVPRTDASNWYLRYLNDESPAFLVQKTGTQSLLNATETKVSWDSEIYDKGSVFGSDKFTARKPGLYRMTASLSMTRDSSSEIDSCSLLLFKNSAFHRTLSLLDIDRNSNLNSEDIFLNGSVDLEVDAGDEFEIYAYQSTGGPFTIQPSTTGSRASTYWSAHFLRRL